MFLGSRVDGALSAYHRRILEHGDRLAVDQVLDIYREQWMAELEAEQDKQGVEWEEELGERAAFELGRQAIELAMNELVPQLGDPVDVQGRLEFTIAPDLEWTVLCYLDLETLRETHDGESASSVVDFKVKSTPITKEKADSGTRPRYPVKPSLVPDGHGLAGVIVAHQCPADRAGYWRVSAGLERDGFTSKPTC